MRKSMLSLAAVAAAGAVMVPGSASAAGWNCSAAALSGQPSGAPVAANGQAAVYRLQTSVPRSARNPKLFPTFTLPRAVELRR